jgi:hypothetical protein
MEVDFADFRRESRDVAMKVVRFEKKKLILPLLMTLLLLGSVVYGTNLRDNVGLDEKVMNNSLEVMTGLTVNILASEYYPNQSGLTNRSILERENKALSEANKLENRKYSNQFISLAPAFLALNTEIYPLSPGSAVSLMTEDRIKYTSQLTFPARDAYISSREIPASAIEIRYRMRKLVELEEEANKTDMNYSEFQQKIEDIKSLDYGDRELRNYVFDNSSTEDDENSNNFRRNQRGLLGFWNTDYDNIKDNLKNDDWTELQTIHFIPSLIASFLLYYLLSGLILTGYRGSSNLAERLLKSKGLNHSIVLASSGFILASGILLLTLATLAAGIPATLIGLFGAGQILVGASLYVVSTRMGESKKWLKSFIVISFAGLIVISIIESQSYSTNIYYSLIRYGVPISVLVGLNSLICWRVEKSIKTDFENDRIGED